MRIDAFLSDKALMLTTRSTYERNLRWIESWLEGRPLTVESFDGQDFDRFWREAHPNWKPATAQRCLHILRSYVRWEGWPDHPILSKHIRVTEPEPPDVLTRDEVRAVLAAIDRSTDKGKRDYAILRLGFETGMRADEFGKIKLRKVDLEGGRLVVLQKRGRQHAPVFGDEVREAIADWLQVRDRHAVNGRLFVSFSGIEAGTGISRAGVYNITREIAEELDLAFSPHVMRYTFVDHALRRGVPMKIIAKQGGWSSIATIERYARGLEAEAYRGFIENYA